MELVDELTTPGCPQCAVKHLSAALYYKARAFANGAADEPQVPEYEELLARAYINLGEVLIGYKSHLWFAVGMLQHAEELAQSQASPDLPHAAPAETAEVARAARLKLELGGESAVRDAMRHIHDDYWLSPRIMASAHLSEAFRELPNFPWGRFLFGPASGFFDCINEIREEYFITDQEVAVDTSEEVAGKGGEEAMATKKAVKAKVDPKAAQAAAKGGKTAKACKGGKCCK